MSAQIADFNIRFNTETAKFQKDVDYAKKMLRGYTKEAKAANDSNVSLGRSLEKTADRAKNAGRGVLDAAGYISAGIGAVTGSTAYLITQQAKQAREIEKMATVAQVSVQQIQALGYASEQFNISGENMAEILKDVNDKLGDFTENEGGEFADFMENIAPTVGLTIEKLQELSGPDALIAIKKAMDEANVPMKSQIFYLESIANDASALMPLLDKQGQKLFELTKKYDDLNVSMSEYDIQKFKEMDQELKDVGLKIQRSFANGVLGASEQIDWFTDKLVVSVDYWSSLFDSMSESPKTKNGLLKKLGDARDEARTVKIELERAQKALESLQATERSAVGNAEVQARLANSRFSEKVNSQESKVSDLTGKYKALIDTVNKYQRQYEDQVLGFNRDGNSQGNENKPQPPIRRLSVDSDVDTGIDKRVAAFRNATNQMEIEWQRRLALSAAGDQQEATQESFAYQDKLARLKESFNAAHEAASDDYNLQHELEREHFLARELLWQEHQENLSRIESEQQTLREEKNQGFWERYLESLQENMMNMDELTAGMLDNFSSGVGNAFESMIYDSQSVGDAFENLAVGMGRSVVNAIGQMAAQWLAYKAVQMAVGKSTAASSAVAMTANANAASMMAGLNAFASTAAIPIVGPAAAPAAMSAALAITGPVALSISALAASGAANMAHNGISEVPMLGGRMESDWTLKAGERVYTNESANQIDQMYSAIMAMQRQRFSMNDPSMANQNRMAANGSGASAQPWTIIIHEAEPGTHAEIDDENKVLNIMMKDAQSGGKYFSYISKTLGVQPGGFK